MIAFPDNELTVEDARKLITLQCEGTVASFRDNFRQLLCKVTPNAYLSNKVCAWLNSEVTNPLLTPHNNDRLRFEFVPGRSTLFSLAIWIGDDFCVNLASAVGADRELLLSNEDPTAITRSAKVLRCLKNQRWGRQLIKGLDIQAQDCVADRMLGEGAFSQVFASSFKQVPCALKRFNTFFKSLPVPVLGELLSEMQLLQRARHENVVECFGAFLWDVHLPSTQPCLLLELMDFAVSDLLDVGESQRSGDNFDRALAAMAELPFRLSIMRQTAEGLAYLHGMSPPIVHRDVKPANLLLRREGSDKFVAKLADFGLSKSTQRQNTSTRGAITMRTNAMAGTEYFKSPEQWRGDPRQTTKADGFSFALTFFAVMCKTPLPWFEADDYRSILNDNSRRFYDLNKVRSHVLKAVWPKWPDQLPINSTTLMPSNALPLLHSITGALLHSRDTQRVSMSTICSWLHEGRARKKNVQQATVKDSVLSLAASWAKRAVTTASSMLELGIDTPVKRKQFLKEVCFTIGSKGDHDLLTSAETLHDVVLAFSSWVYKQSAKRIVPPYFDSDFPLPEFLCGIKELALPSNVDVAIGMLRHVPNIKMQPLLQAVEECKVRLASLRSIWRSQVTIGKGQQRKEAIQLHNMDDDALLSILLYTAQCSELYPKMNAALRNGDRQQLLYFLPYMKLLLVSLQQYGERCPWRCQTCALSFRGTKLSASKLVPQHLIDGVVTYWSFNSSASLNDVPRDSGFVAKEFGTYFQTHNTAGIDISPVTLFPKEKEVLILPGARFQVLDVYQPNPVHDYTQITLKQIEPGGDNKADLLLAQEYRLQALLMSTKIEIMEVGHFGIRVRWSIPPGCDESDTLSAKVRLQSLDDAHLVDKTFDVPPKHLRRVTTWQFGSESDATATGDRTPTSSDPAATNSTTATAAPNSTNPTWYWTKDMVVVPNQKYSIQVTWIHRGTNVVASYVTHTKTLTTVPARANNVKAVLKNTWDKLKLKVRFQCQPGANNVDQVRVVAYTRLKPHSRMTLIKRGAEPAAYIYSVLKVLDPEGYMTLWFEPPPEWRGRRCTVFVQLHGDAGWSDEITNDLAEATLAAKDGCDICLPYDIVQLSKSQRKRLIGALRRSTPGKAGTLLIALLYHLLLLTVVCHCFNFATGYVRAELNTGQLSIWAREPNDHGVCATTRVSSCAEVSVPARCRRAQSGFRWVSITCKPIVICSVLLLTTDCG